MVKEKKSYKLPSGSELLSRVDKVNLIQAAAVDALLSVNHGTVVAATGIGKTFIFFKYLYKRWKRGEIDKKSLIWFMAETDIREKTLRDESDEFERYYPGFHPMRDFNIVFKCYQSLPVGNPVVLACDEVHNSLSEKFQQVYNNDRTYTVAFSATIPRNLRIYRDDVNSITKGELLAKVAPIVFIYNADSAIEDGVLAPFQTTIINHVLDAQTNNIPSTIKGNPVIQTEHVYYRYRKSIVDNPSSYPYYKKKCGLEMAKLLWRLPSKVDIIKKLIRSLEGSTIIFGVELDLLEQITPNVVKGGGKLQESVNLQLIDFFNSGKIKVIGSAKKLKQGITLEGVTNCILVSYYSESWHTIQQLGRVIRFKPGKLANLYIIKTVGTLEEKWYDQMQAVKDENGTKISNINLNVCNIISSNEIGV